VDDDPVGVVDVAVDTVLELAVATPHALVLVEHGLPGLVVATLWWTTRVTM